MWTRHSGLKQKVVLLHYILLILHIIDPGKTSNTGGLEISNQQKNRLHISVTNRRTQPLLVELVAEIYAFKIKIHLFKSLNSNSRRDNACRSVLILFTRGFFTEILYVLTVPPIRTACPTN